METKHTPGPWVTHRPTSFGTFYIDARLSGPTLQEVAAVGPTHRPEQQAANARLIAAAPDLLDALLKIPQRYLDDMDAHTPGAAQLIRAAIVKATKEPA